MTTTKVIIIYSPNQNRRRIVIKPDDDSHIDRHINNIAKGESVLIGSLADYDSIGPDVMLEKHTGQKAASDRCVVVDANGNVVSGCRADPLIDIHPAGNVHQHDTACVGWSLRNGQWIEPPAPLSAADIIFYPDSLTSIAPFGMWNSKWSISCTKNNLSIGCETHTISEWNGFKDSRITLMDIDALSWWTTYKPQVMTFANNHLQRCSAASEAVA